MQRLPAGLMVRAISRSFFDRDVDDVARALIGATLSVNGVGGLIVETESYDVADPASHSYGGRRTARNQAMFGAPGAAYVYRSYGIHWCFNIVCRPGHAVLIRALEPTEGIPRMQGRRHMKDIHLLCAGPGRLCEALAITGTLNGASTLKAPFHLSPRADAPQVCVGPRIGITKAAAALRRFGVENCRYVSRPFRK
jgi:DNA-3-methyladenine glycosylase